MWDYFLYFGDKHPWLIQGVIQGFIALILVNLLIWWLNWRKERPNIEIEVADDNSFYFKWDDSDKYAAGFRLVVWARISNLSSLPNSIYRFIFQLPDQEEMLSYIHLHPLEEYRFSIEKGYWKSLDNSLPVNKYHLKPIITLEPYKSIEGWIFFSHCPVLDGVTTGKLIVKTSRKDFEKTITLRQYGIKE
jgi:hypothetical protein